MSPALASSSATLAATIFSTCASIPAFACSASSSFFSYFWISPLSLSISSFSASISALYDGLSGSFLASLYASSLAANSFSLAAN